MMLFHELGICFKNNLPKLYIKHGNILTDFFDSRENDSYVAFWKTTLIQW